MTFGTGRSDSSTGYDHRRLPPNALQQRALGGATLVSVAALCAWALCSTVADTSPHQINLAGARGDRFVVVARRGDKLVILKPSLLAANVAISLFDPRSSLGSSTATFTNSTSLQGDAPTRSLPLALAGNPPFRRCRHVASELHKKWSCRCRGQHQRPGSLRIGCRHSRDDFPEALWQACPGQARIHCR